MAPSTRASAPANYSNGYLVDKQGEGHYDLKKPRGVVLKIAPGKKPEIVATGVRYLTSMSINRHGDLFATDQEGATWLPNGNPFDELLHIQKGRHYGFPPRHPKHLPDVIDEPSVFDYGPQHQSTCGFRFNEPVGKGKGKTFGPSHWRNAAFVTGESRGKLYRTRLVKTPAGYVAQNQVIASLGMLPVDVAVSNWGDLVVACHSGPPDWGTGPAGTGKLFMIEFEHSTEPIPVVAWAASPTETIVEFDRSLEPLQWKNLSQTIVEGGLYVSAGDRFERFRPGYEVVKAQMKSPRFEYPVLSAGLGSNGRSIILRTAERTDAFRYAITLPYPEKEGRAAGIDVAFDLTGVDASWRETQGTNAWHGWLPHLDGTVNRELTASTDSRVWLSDLMSNPGTLTLRTQLDLWSMLHPAVQAGATLDYEYPPEAVTVAFRWKRKLSLDVDKSARVEVSDGLAKLIVAPVKDKWLPVTLTLATDKNAGPLDLEVSWSTKEDPRPRALPLHRMLMPWAVPAREKPGSFDRVIPEIAGGDWGQGKKIYFGEKAACSKCHAVRGEGAHDRPRPVESRLPRLRLGPPRRQGTERLDQSRLPRLPRRARRRQDADRHSQRLRRHDRPPRRPDRQGDDDPTERSPLDRPVADVTDAGQAARRAHGRPAARSVPVPARSTAGRETMRL